jgi:hypothetical protein
MLVSGLSAQQKIWDSKHLKYLNSYFDRYCYDCHGIDSRQKGGIELESKKFGLTNRKNLYFWSRVHEVISTGEMPPPKKKKQPTADEKKKVLYALGRSLYRADTLIDRQLERRLSNKEIENALFDVFGSSVDSKAFLGAPESITGFDNQYTDLQLTAGFMMRYNKYIDAFLNDFFTPLKSTTYSSGGKGLKEKGSIILLDDKISIKQGGRYKLNVSFESGPKDLQVYVGVVSKGDVAHPKMHIPGQGTLSLESNLHVGDNFYVRSSSDSRTTAKLKIKKLTLEGPLNNFAKFYRLAGVNSGKDLQLSNGRKLLSTALPLLYGRSSSPELATYAKDVKEGMTPLDAARKSIKKALLSLEFLYGVDVKSRNVLSGLSTARRMARMLWRSVPDRELLVLAGQNKLIDPAVRVSQAERMIKDFRFARFKKSFFGSWIGTGEFYKLENVTKDYFPKFYQQGEDAVLYSLYEQLDKYLNDIVDENRSIVELISSDWTYANDLINQNYKLGLSGLGKQLKKVKLPSGSIRGGLLTQGAFARLTSSVNDTSPVKRGVWILENMLGEHIPSPPEVEGFEPNVVGAQSLKEQFMKHRNNEACSSCHSKIDPIGFLFETLDPLGEERTAYAISAKMAAKNKPAPVDLEPMDFKGTSMKDLNDFKAYVRKNSKDTIAKIYMYKLAMYTFGRDKSFKDKTLIKKILDADKSGYKTKDLLRQFVASPLFVK